MVLDGNSKGDTALLNPRVAEVWRKWKEHETLSGHSGLGNGWRDAFIFDAVMRSGYGGF